jgi:beta-glucuronidase
LLVEEPAVFIQDYSIQIKKGDRNAIAGFVQLNNAVKKEKTIISIPELRIEREIEIAADGKSAFEIDGSDKIKYWSPESPKLYTVILKTSYQIIKDVIGFKTIETRGPDIFLNEKPVFLRGICIHEEINGRRANNEADAFRLLTWAK